MTTAAYCELCDSNVYVRDDGTCPAGHGPEHLTDYYEVGGGQGAGAGAAPTPRKPNIGRLALGVLIAIVLFLLCGCVTVGAIFLTSDDEPSSETSAVTPDTGAGVAGDTAEGSDSEEYPGEAEYLEEFLRIETEASEAVGTLDELYPAETEEDARELAEAADALAASHASARDLEAPARYLAIHDHLVEGLRAYAEAVAIMESNGFLELDEEASVEASELWLQGAESFQKMVDALEAFESVWGE
jgi:hypothetical protein